MNIRKMTESDMIELAKEKGMDKVKANIYSFNTQSQRMFQSVGFVKTEEEWFEYSISEKLNGEGHSCGHGGCHH
ncbi:hypothetical protein [Butyrivibrio sp. MB2005]|uniref:hypothetical protein n=1 Tax=Butyrivibrio sp. MB2005 TaxID=1280678 RepID=UPI0003FC1829|nr:hypothetical protein [Butyrivibrio sp. MB2005]